MVIPPLSECDPWIEGFNIGLRHNDPDVTDPPLMQGATEAQQMQFDDGWIYAHGLFHAEA